MNSPLKSSKNQNSAEKIWEIIPLANIPYGSNYKYSYSCTGPAQPDEGSLVKISLGAQEVEGIVVGPGKKYRFLKNIKKIVRQRIISLDELEWIESLADVFLEPVPMLLKRLVSVRRPFEARIINLKNENKFGVNIHKDLSGLSKISKGQNLILVPEKIIGKNIKKILDHLDIPAFEFSQTSKVSERKKILEILNSGTPINIISTHSGIFLPFSKMASIWIIECSLASHKQWDLHPRYDARVCAFLKCKKIGATLNIHSSLPYLDLYNINNTTAKGDLSLFSAKVCYKDPSVAFPLVPETEKAIRDALYSNESIFIFNNTVGKENTFVCKKCGNILKCETCNTILEKEDYYLVCPNCSKKSKLSSNFCGQCGSPNIVPLKIGTEGLEKYLTKVFPKVPIVKLDRKTVSFKGTTTSSARIYVGTEKTFSFINEPFFSLAVIINADALTSIETYSATEDALKLIARVRSLIKTDKADSLIIQTSSPSFSLFSKLKSNSLAQWIQEELKDRKDLNYPPFVPIYTFEKIYKNELEAQKDLNKQVKLFNEKKVNFLFRTHKTRNGYKNSFLIKGKLSVKSIPKNWTLDSDIPLSFEFY